jgi:RimJ/RimL family protein N-acetyltransferase
MRQFLGALPWVAGEPSVEASEVYCRTARANFISRTDMVFLAFERSSQQLVGSVGLHRPVWATPKFEVGFWCRTSRVGEGLVTEAVEVVATFAFSELGAVRLELVTDEENARARHVADKCSFQLEGILRAERRAPDGSLRNTCMYARLHAL